MEFFTPSHGLTLFTLLIMSYFGLLVFAIIDIVKSNFKDNDKLIWVLVTLFAPLGAIIYVVVGRGKKIS